MRVLVAPQEFKGTLSAVEAARAMAEAIRSSFSGWQVDVLPMADGGPGTTAALLAARGGEARQTAAYDPLMRLVTAEWALLPSGTAVIESAAASGLWRLRSDELDPRRATTYGTGQLVAAALDAGCREVILGLGGSATNDGGAGLAQALGFALLDAGGKQIGPGGAALSRLYRIDAKGAYAAISRSRFIGATDVTNPLCGPKGAAAVYGPQKGADPAAVKELDAALAHFAAVLKRDLGADFGGRPGAGAAGGLGAGSMAFLGAELRSGAEIVGEAAGLEARIAAADVVITGEGRVDAQTGFGKAPQHVARLARSLGRPVLCVAGSLGPGYERLAPWFDILESPPAPPRASLPAGDEAAEAAAQAAVRAILRLLAGSRGVAAGL